MQDLKVIGVESGTLLLVSEAGERFRIPISEIAQAGVSSAIPTASAPAREAERRLPPKEIQAHIRAGMSAAEVARVTGSDLSYVQRFEGPVLAEREYVVNGALAVPVHSPLDTGPLGEGSTFGVVIRQRLAELEAGGEVWTSWKQPAGEWVVKLAFTIGDIEHDARWSFDVKRQLLAPLNSEATTLSQQGKMTGPLIPKLRAVDVQTGAHVQGRPGRDSGAVSEQHPSASGRLPDSSRFDSGAFASPEVARRGPSPVEPRAGRVASSDHEPAEQPAWPLRLRTSPEQSRVDATPEQDDDAPGGAMLPFERRRPQAAADERDSSDLLESLRRRRGQREPGGFGEEDLGLPLSGRSTEDQSSPDEPRSTQVIDIPLGDYAPSSADDHEGLATTAPQPPLDAAEPVQRGGRKQSTTGGHGRRGRASMPSWDEIVFGTKTDDDPA